MFLPLGIGGLPHKFPIVIVGLALVCTFWSLSFFPTVTMTDRTVNNQLQKLNLSKLQTQIMVDSCLQKFKLPNACQNLGVKDFQAPGSSTKTRDLASEAKEPLNLSTLLAISDYTQLFENEKTWPKEALEHPLYQRIVGAKKVLRQIYKKHSFFSSANRSLPVFIQATFVHGSVTHLIGNLLLLILIGIWVEQCLGALFTILIFLGGSFIGLYLELIITNPPALLGASAGVMALLGAYFILFYKTETQMIFIAFPVYFKSFSIPSLWFFPFFYLATDFLEVASSSHSGVAHWGHIGGLLFGLLSGFFFRQQIPLGKDELFPQERKLVATLQTTQDPALAWKIMHQLNRWNPQNWNAQALFLEKLKGFGLENKDPKRLKWLEKVVEKSTRHILKRGAIDDMIRWLEIIPPKLDLEFCLRAIPLSQTLFLADTIANKENYSLAKQLFQLSLEKKPNDDLELRIHQSINLINTQIQNRNLKTESQAKG